jgi:hypothetical protein
LRRTQFALVAPLVVAVWLAGSAAVAALPPEQESQLLQEAEGSMMGRQFAKALPLYAKLYEETRNPVYLRNLGRCHQFLGHAEEAIAAFQQYIGINGAALSDAEKAEVQGFIAEMEQLRQRQQEAARPPAPGPSPAPVVAAPATPPAAPPASPTETRAKGWSRWSRHVGYGGIAAGGAAVVAGSILAVTSASAASSAKSRATGMPSLPVWQQAKRDHDSAQSRNRVGWTVAGIGAAMVATGIFVVTTSPRRGSEVAIAPLVTADLAGLVVDARW